MCVYFCATSIYHTYLLTYGVSMMGAVSWWRHQMETFSALLALCAGNSPVPVNSPHKGQWRGTLMFSLICARINDWVNNREAGDLRRHRTYDVTVMHFYLICSRTIVVHQLMLFVDCNRLKIKLIVLCYVSLFCIVSYRIVYCIVYCVTLICIVLYIVLHWFILYCIALHCIALYCIAV